MDIPPIPPLFRGVRAVDTRTLAVGASVSLALPLVWASFLCHGPRGDRLGVRCHAAPATFAVLVLATTKPTLEEGTAEGVRTPATPLAVHVDGGGGGVDGDVPPIGLIATGAEAVASAPVPPRPTVVIHVAAPYPAQM